MEVRREFSGLKRPWITSEKRLECLELFNKGYGYKKTARLTGLKIYTVRDYYKRYIIGNTSWAYRFCQKG